MILWFGVAGALVGGSSLDFGVLKKLFHALYLRVCTYVFRTGVLFGGGNLKSSPHGALCKCYISITSQS